jgi:hypothetical protein
VTPTVRNVSGVMIMQIAMFAGFLTSYPVS